MKKRKPRVVAIVQNRINSQLLDELFEWQHEKNISTINIMAKRLSSIEHIKKIQCIINGNNKTIYTRFQKTRWGIIDRTRPRLTSLVQLLKLLRYSYFCIFDHLYPFIDPQESTDLILKMYSNSLLALHVNNGQQFVPSLIVHRKVLLQILFRKIIQKQDISWNVIKQFIHPSRLLEISLTSPQTAECLQTDTITRSNLKEFGKNLASRASLLHFEKQNQQNIVNILNNTRDQLHEYMQTSKYPNKWNLRLSRFESTHKFDHVKSFPLDIAFNITNQCNARCVFCSYEPGKVSRDLITLEHFKNFEYLKYVRKVGLGGDIGEPLINPEFLSIYKYLRKTFAHLQLRIITNGIGLTKDLCHEFVGSLDKLRVSLNASNRDTWSRLMRSQGFDRIVENIRYLSKLKKKLKSDYPRIFLLMVVCKENIHEVVDFVKLAREIGVDEVSFSHFHISVMEKHELSTKASMYYNKKIFDEWMNKARQCANESGITIDDPVPFYKTDYEYFEGSRVRKSPEHCLLPWQTCYLTGIKEMHQARILNFCCSGFSSHVQYKPENLTTANFIKLWNDKKMKFFRRTANSSKNNPYCHFCYTQDRIDPENKNFYILKKKSESFL